MQIADYIRGFVDFLVAGVAVGVDKGLASQRGLS